LRRLDFDEIDMLKNPSSFYFKFLGFYFKFLEFARELGADGLVGLDAAEEKLLIQLGQRWHRGWSTTVCEGMSLIPGVSIGTTHRRLKSLRSKGLLTLTQDAKDQRVKFIVPTTLACKYFEILDASLKLAVGEKNQAFKKVFDPIRSLERSVSIS
jgi:hypothetical protein